MVPVFRDHSLFQILAVISTSIGSYLSLEPLIKHLTICRNLIHFNYYRPVGNASASGAIILQTPPTL